MTKIWIIGLLLVMTINLKCVTSESKFKLFVVKSLVAQTINYIYLIWCMRFLICSIDWVNKLLTMCAMNILITHYIT